MMPPRGARRLPQPFRSTCSRRPFECGDCGVGQQGVRDVGTGEAVRCTQRLVDARAALLASLPPAAVGDGFSSSRRADGRRRTGTAADGRTRRPR